MLPTDGTPVVQWRVQGSFPVVQPFLPTGWTTIYPDGTVLSPSRANAFAQPQVWPYEVGHVDPADVLALLTGAQAAGLLEQSSAPWPAPPGVVDAAMTTLVLTSVDGSFRHEALGLGTGADPTDGARAALMKLVGEIAELVNRGVASGAGGSTVPPFYAATMLDVVAVEVTDDNPGQGTNTVVAWAGDADLATWTSCTTVDDGATVSFLVGQLAGPKFQQGDRLYRIVSRVHPPGTTCD